ncbi:hypothetical protein AB0N99_37405 [Streptomyces sp. NPDC093272]|uniref:hypothetical protein n=1 Tax=unclassified Streptomyces TaxID=2593676 RepID=UPI00343035EC
MNWTQMHDCYGDVDRVPTLLERVEFEDDAEAWEELGYRLVPEHDLVFPAGFAALPSLVGLASRSAQARGPAGAILRGVAGHHGCDDLLADCADAIAEFRNRWTATCNRDRSTTWRHSSIYLRQGRSTTGVPS